MHTQGFAGPHTVESGKAIYTYEIDSSNLIASVSENWDAFALQNEGEAACAGHVLGRPWWDFVAGEEVRMLYAGLLQKVRQTKLRVSVPFRCDGPAVRRFMTMTILPRPDEAVLFQCEIVREEPRTPVLLLAREVARNRSLLNLCGWCGKVELDKSWVEMDAAIRTLKLFESDTMPLLSHGICPTCEARFDEVCPGD